jgi:hypothetical protein
MSLPAMSGRIFALALLMVLPTGQPAAAQATAIQIGEKATWRQDDARFTLPPTLDGLVRTQIVDYGERRLDVSATYRTAADGTYATVYLFRPAIADAAMWHERALLSIRPHETLGDPDHGSADTVTAALPEETVPTALLTVMPLTGKGWRSTGLAVFQLRDWLVKVRMSSPTLAPAELTARLQSLVAALDHAKADPSQGALAPMAPCAEALKFKSARRAGKPDIGATLVAGLFAGSLAQAGVEGDDEANEFESLPPNAYCRDEASQADYGVYRRAGTSDGYTIAIADAGVSVGVHQNSLTEMLGGKDARGYWITLSNPYETATYRGFRSMPRPEQVINVIDREGPVSRTSLGDEGNANIRLTTP